MTRQMMKMNSDPSTWNSHHGGRISSLIDIVQQAGNHTLKYFQSDELVVDAKSDDSPVTVADREAESLTRNLIASRFPDDSVQGEEHDDTTGSSSYRWIVDPIDGTKSFVCGVPLYSTLLALEIDGAPLAGAIYIPALAELIVGANDLGSWHQKDGGNWTQARVRSQNELSQSVFVTSQVDTFGERDAQEAYRRIERQAWITRSWGDGYGYLLVATGRADIMIDPICNAWDVAAIQPIIEQAGGKFTDWKGNATTRGGDGVATAGLLHDTVLSLLNK